MSKAKLVFRVVLYIFLFLTFVYNVYDVGRIDTRLKLLHSSLPTTTVLQCYEALKR